MILACIDIGSNTTRLLVADAEEDRLEPLASERAFTRIGRSIHEAGEIPEAKIAETAEVVAVQAGIARKAGAEQIAAVATAAIRDAPNRAELAAAVEDAGGVPLWVLSSDEEAEMSFVGATRTLGETLPGPLAVTDVGGGSTEVAVGRPGGDMTWCASYPIGSGLLADLHLRSDPPAPAELDAARAQVEEVLAALDPPPVQSAVAVGGTATSLRRLVGHDLTRDALEHGLRALVAMPVDEAAARYELDPRRVRLLPPGILVLEALSERLGVALRTARGGLREGVVLELLERRQGA